MCMYIPWDSRCKSINMLWHIYLVHILIYVLCVHFLVLLYYITFIYLFIIIFIYLMCIWLIYPSTEIINNSLNIDIADI